MKRLVIAILLNALVGVGALLAADSPVGKWKTLDEKTGKVVSEVEPYRPGEAKIFGKITGLTEPNDAQGKPKVCSKCQGAEKGPGDRRPRHREGSQRQR